MGNTLWSKAVFQGSSDPFGFQAGSLYTIQIQWPGQFYPYKVVSQELGATATNEYLDKAAIRQDWRFEVEQEGGPADA